MASFDAPPARYARERKRGGHLQAPGCRLTAGSMRPFTSTISVAEARAIALRAVRPITRVERVAIDEAAGRVLATAVVAEGDVPPFDRAAVDGYAVIAADTRGAGTASPCRLHCVGLTHAGEAAPRRLLSGECVEIATGAPLPAGADAAVMVERTSREADVVLVSEPVSPWRNVGRRGNDLVAGRPVLEGGTWLTPARLGALAAAGAAAVDVFVRPRVAIASSGNELVEAGRPLGPGQIREVNRFTLPAVVRAHGGDVVPMPAIPDTLGAIRDAFDAAAGADLFIVTGGTSVGTRDLLVDVARERGDVLFHGVSMKPGMPALLAALHAPEEHQGRLAAAASAALHNRLDSAVEEALFPAGRLFLGLPGNPTSCLSVAYVLLVPLLRAVARLPEWRPMTRTLTLSAAVDSPLNRHQFYPVRVEDDRAVPAFKGSGEITSLSGADGYIEIPEGVDQIAEGTPVTVVPF